MNIYTRNIIAFLLFLIASCCYSENIVVDSLKKRLQDKISIKEKTETLNELSWELSVNNPEEGKIYAKQALNLSLNNANPEGEATAYNRLGLSYEISGVLDSAVYFYNLSYDKRLLLNDINGASNVVLNIGAMYYIQGYYNLALKYYLQCAELIEKHKKDLNILTLAKVYNNIGLIHRTKKEYSEAINWYIKSLSIKRINNDDLGLLNSYINLSMSYQNAKDFNSSNLYIDSALMLATQKKWENEFSGIYTNKASILKDKQNYPLALQYLKEAQKWLDSYPDKHISTFTLFQIAEVYYELKDYQKAITYLNNSIEKAQAVNRREILQRAYELLSICYEKTGNFKLAYQTNCIHKAINDSVFNIESKRSLDEQQIIFKVKENENKISQLNSENEKQELIINQTELKFLYSSILLIISVLGIFILVYAWRQKRKNNLILNQKNEIVAQALNEKEILIKEIHHRVKNNLQIITGLLELQESLHQNKEVGNLVSEAQGRIKTMAIIHEMLYQSEDIAKINLEEYVTKLIDSIAIGFSNKTVTVIRTIHIHNIFFNIDTIIPLGLILNELVSNAYKYVYCQGKGTKLDITIENITKDEWILNVKDDGLGVSNNGNGEREGSFGLKLVKMLSRQLKGKVNYEYNNGSVFSITFKEQKLRE